MKMLNVFKMYIKFFLREEKILGIATMKIFKMSKLAIWLVCFFFSIGLGVCIKRVTLNADYISSVKNKILSDGYDKDVVPTINERPVEVAISMYLADMFPTVKSLMHYGMNCYFRMRWQDYRLAYNRTEDELYLPFDHRFVEKIWMPNIYFPTLKQGNHHSLIRPNYAGFLYSNGTVLVVIRLSITSFCDMNLKYFPFDVQKCDFFIECYTYPNNYVVLRWENGTTIQRDHDLHSFDFQEVVIEKKTGNINYAMFGVYSQLILKFTMYRHLLLYILSDFLPCILIVALSWMSFWINYRSTPARVAFGITTILTSITTTNTVRGESIGIFRSIDYYTLMCNIFVFLSFMEYALVGVTESECNSKKTIKANEELEKRSEINNYITRKLSQTSNGFYPHFLDQEALNFRNFNSQQQRKQEQQQRKQEQQHRCYKENAEENEEPTFLLKSPTKTGKKKKRNGSCRGFFVFRQDQNPHIIDRISRILFPAAFIAFNILFFLYHEYHPDTIGNAN